MNEALRAGHNRGDGDSQSVLENPRFCVPSAICPY